MAEPLSSFAYKVSVYPLDNVEGQARWSALVKESSQATPFTSVTYALALVNHLALSAEIWIVGDTDRDLTGLVVFKKKQGPFSRGIIPGFTPHSPIVYAGDAQPNEAIQILLNKLCVELDDVRLHLPPGFMDARPLRWTGWDSSVYYTYQIDLSTYDDNRQGWSKATRRNFQKHESTYQITEDPTAIGQCISLCNDGYVRNKRAFPIHPQHLLSITQALSDAGCIRTFTASPDDTHTPEAGIVVLRDEHTAYYWIAGSIPGPAMTVLIGKVLDRLKSDGLKTFDFVGANTPGIAEFKRRFGPRLVPYFAGWVTPNRLLSGILKTKRMLRG